MQNKLFLFLSGVALALLGCTGSGSNDNAPIEPSEDTYVAIYEYPPNDLLPCSVQKSVKAIGTKSCKNSKGEEVEKDRCRSHVSAPEITYQSPAGEIDLQSVTPGTYTGSPKAFCDVGSSTQSIVPGSFTCNPGYSKNAAGSDCIQTAVACDIGELPANAVSGLKELIDSAYGICQADTCLPGYYPLAGLCLEAQAGSVADGTSVQSCSTGTYQDLSGQNSCKSCSAPSGVETYTFNPSAGLTSDSCPFTVNSCPLDFYIDGNSCSPETYVASFGAATAPAACEGTKNVPKPMTDCVRQSDLASVSLTKCFGQSDYESLQSVAGNVLVAPIKFGERRVTCDAGEDYMTAVNIMDNLYSVCSPEAYPNGLFCNIKISEISPNLGSCFVGADSKLYCWGDNQGGQLKNANWPLGYLNTYECTTGNLCSNFALDMNFSGGFSSVKSVASGAYHHCAISSGNRVFCWGFNGTGQLGNGSLVDSDIPVFIDDSSILPLQAKKISSSDESTCVIAGNSTDSLADRVFCWGLNTNGRFGAGATSDTSYPVAMNMGGALNGLYVKKIAIGNGHACLIASNDKLYCAGGNNWGQFGNGQTTSSNIPVASATSGPISALAIKDVGVGDLHTCVIAGNAGNTLADKVYCFGKNTFGQLGNGSTTDSITPVQVLPGSMGSSEPTQLASGYEFNCVLDSDNKAHCWGRNGGYGTLGDGTWDDSSTPVAVDTSGALSGVTLTKISASSFVACVVDDGGAAYCWGDSSMGQLGSVVGVSPSPKKVNVDFLSY